MVLSAFEGSLGWWDHGLRARNIFSCLLYLLGFLGASASWWLPGLWHHGFFSFLGFPKIVFANEKWGAFRKNNFIAGLLCLREEQPGSPYQLLQAHPLLASFHFLSSIPEPQAAIVSRTALLGSPGTRPPRASCCYKASPSCWKQQHLPAYVTLLGQLISTTRRRLQ